jgi:predicted regulator of Ras-like GTPase activity (Roadblock/LC7/MglB family)
MSEMPFEETLDRIISEGNLPIATVPSDYDTEITAAMVALLRRVARETQDQVGMARLDEVSIRASDRIRLVCRYFSANGEDFILAVVVPSHQRYYRRLTNRAITEIRLTWRAIVKA